MSFKWLLMLVNHKRMLLVENTEHSKLKRPIRRQREVTYDLKTTTRNVCLHFPPCVFRRQLGASADLVVPSPQPTGLCEHCPTPRSVFQHVIFRPCMISLSCNYCKVVILTVHIGFSGTPDKMIHSNRGSHETFPAKDTSKLIYVYFNY